MGERRPVKISGKERTGKDKRVMMRQVKRELAKMRRVKIRVARMEPVMMGLAKRAAMRQNGEACGAARPQNIISFLAAEPHNH